MRALVYPTCFVHYGTSVRDAPPDLDARHSGRFRAFFLPSDSSDRLEFSSETEFIENFER